MVDELKFHAWLDGELDPAEAEAIATEVERDPELRRRAAQHRAFAARTTTAFGQLAHAPAPHVFLEAVHSDDNVIDLARERAKRRPAPRSHVLSQLAALMATLAIGCFAGTMTVSRSSGPLTGSIAGSPPGPVAIADGQIVAAASLGHALDEQLTGSAGEAGVRIGLTFRDRSGAMCRSFTMPVAAGLACRDDGKWALRGLFNAPVGQQSGERAASGENPQLVALIDSAMEGAPLDAAQEQAALASGWK
jgi:hypothetical protein